MSARFLTQSNANLTQTTLPQPSVPRGQIPRKKGFVVSTKMAAELVCCPNPANQHALIFQLPTEEMFTTLSHNLQHVQAVVGRLGHWPIDLNTCKYLSVPWDRTLKVVFLYSRHAVY